MLISRSKKMHVMIYAILHYSRIGREKENLVTVNLNELIKTVWELLSPPDNMKIEVEEPLPTLSCEETRINQVFMNLIGNAVKYNDKSEGKVYIRCEK